MLRRVDVDRPEEQAPDAAARMRVPVGDSARREVDAVAAHDPCLRGVELDVAARARASPPSPAELPDERRPVDVRGAEVRLVRADVVDDPVAGRGLDTRPDARRARVSMEVLAAVDDDGLAGDERRGRPGEVDDGADDVLGLLVALDRPGRDRHVAELLDHLRDAA